MLGDCETAALVSRAGAIDWLCWPRFDSGACFAALLGRPEHGRWLLTAADASARITRRCRDDTLILETDFETADGRVTVIDLIPLRDEGSSVIRLVVGKRGRLGMRTELIVRFDYGSLVPWVTRVEAASAPWPGRTAWCCAHRCRCQARTAKRLVNSPSPRVKSTSSCSAISSPTGTCRLPSVRQWHSPRRNASGENGLAKVPIRGNIRVVRRSLITLKARGASP